MNRLLKSYTVIVFAGILYAIALKYFILPSKVILTGTEGIATALSYYFESFNLFIVLYVIFQALLLVFAFYADQQGICPAIAGCRQHRCADSVDLARTELCPA